MRKWCLTAFFLISYLIPSRLWMLSRIWQWIIISKKSKTEENLINFLLSIYATLSTFSSIHSSSACRVSFFVISFGVSNFWLQSLVIVTSQVKLSDEDKNRHQDSRSELHFLHCLVCCFDAVVFIDFPLLDSPFKTQN